MSTNTTNYSFIKPELSDDIKLQTIPNLATDMDLIDTEFKNQSNRINNIVSQSGDDITEIVDTRHNNISDITFSSLSERVDTDYQKVRDIGFNVKDAQFGAIGNGSTDDYTAINAANTAATVNGGNIYFPAGTYLLNSSITFASNVRLVFSPGAKLKIANTKTITGTNTKIDAGLFQIFDLSLGGTLAGTWNVKEVYPEWFGAVGDASIGGIGTNDGTALVNTLSFANLANKLVFLNKLYYTTSQLTISGLTIRGADKRISGIVGNYAGFFLYTTNTNFTLQDICISGHTSTQASAISYGLDATNAPHQWNIINVDFHYLHQAFKFQAAWNGFIQNTNVYSCGTASLYACWLGTGTGGNETNGITYNHFRIEGSASWAGKGLYIENLDHNFQGLYIEGIRVPDACYINAEGWTINGGYFEYQVTSANNIITFNKKGVVSGCLFNCEYVLNDKVIFIGSRYYLTNAIKAKGTYINCHQPDTSGYVQVTNIEDIPVIKNGTITNFSFYNGMSGNFEEFGVGDFGDIILAGDSYFQAAHKLENQSTTYFSGTRALKWTLLDAGTADGGCSKFHVIGGSGNICCGAIVRAYSANTTGTIQVMIGQQVDQEDAMQCPADDNWYFIWFVDVVMDYPSVSIKVIKADGGGAATNGDYGFIDALVVQKGGVDFSGKLFPSATNRYTKYYYDSAAPSTGTWEKGDRVINNDIAAGEYSGWICVTAGSPGIWKGFGLIES